MFPVIQLMPGAGTQPRLAICYHIQKLQENSHLPHMTSSPTSLYSNRLPLPLHVCNVLSFVKQSSFTFEETIILEAVINLEL
jgi:hypothetical protein